MTGRLWHPTLEASRAALVQRSDREDLFGVAVRGHRHVHPLPEGYDGRTSVNFVDGYVVVAHPVKPPLIIDPLTGKTREVDASLLPQRAPILRH